MIFRIMGVRIIGAFKGLLVNSKTSKNFFGLGDFSNYRSSNYMSLTVMLFLSNMNLYIIQVC